MSLRLTAEEFEALKERAGKLQGLRCDTGNKPKFKRVDSKAKQDLELIFLSLGLEITREFRFHPDRKWRFDYAIIMPIDISVQTCDAYEQDNENTGKRQVKTE